MKKQEYDNFTKIILDVTNFNWINDALFYLLRKEYIKFERRPKGTYIDTAYYLLKSLEDIEFEHDNDNISAIEGKRKIYVHKKLKEIVEL